MKRETDSKKKSVNFAKFSIEKAHTFINISIYMYRVGINIKYNY